MDTANIEDHGEDAETGLVTTTPMSVRPHSGASLGELRTLAQGKGMEAIEAQREIDRQMAEIPGLAAIGNPFRLALHQMARSHFNNCEVARSAFLQSINQKREELGASTASPLERDLIDEVALTWAGRYIADAILSQSLSGENTITQIEYLERRVSATQRRYVRAVETLAKVRRLEIPPTVWNVAQQNIGREQTNIANTGALPSADP